jgi:FkbM family methyltransferase
MVSPAAGQYSQAMSRKLILGKLGRHLLGRELYTRLNIGKRREYRFLRYIGGIVHVGANTGQEAELYDSFGVGVIWIEPIPEVFENLKRHISGFPKQAAFNYLVTDEDDKDCTLHIANNGGASSSILDLGGHSQMWPDVKYTHTITARGITLGSLLTREDIDVRKFDALILDTQGSELKILKGAASLLPNFRFVKVEVPDFESYKGCCQISELSRFMLSNGFSEHSRVPFMYTSDLGTYFDVVYRSELH